MLKAGPNICKKQMWNRVVHVNEAQPHLLTKGSRLHVKEACEGTKTWDVTAVNGEYMLRVSYHACAHDGLQ